MNEEKKRRLSNWLPEEHLRKVEAIDCDELHDFLVEFLELCTPERVFVCTDAPEDVAYVRNAAVTNNEEERLAVEGHTVHYDGYNDQARDKAKTWFLATEGKAPGDGLNAKDKEEGLKDIYRIMKGIMVGKELYICFFCLGPANSDFSIPAVQLTDSAYVAHSEHILYRKGYEEFRRQGNSARFFRFIHSAGALDERNTSANIEERRVYIDCEEGRVFSANTQYGGNTIGLKKLAMRLAIHRAAGEGWLTEHMMLMGINGPNERVTYIAGAFPSMCGKTSTAMIPWEKMVGDDIAYIRERDGQAFAVNVESGMFGIIMGVNKTDDPIIWEVLHSPNELIVSNILVTDEGTAHWLEMGEELPTRGKNQSGEWTLGKKDSKGNEITASHRNARFTVALPALSNTDERLEDPEGVRLEAMIYGGRDSDTWVPVQQAFDWTHGIITKAAALESETTAATLGQKGVRKFNPMSNLDFVSIPLAKYLQINLDFGTRLAAPPQIFGINYFIKDRQGNFLNEKTDKGVWLKWIERRLHGDVEAIRTPTGFIPLYEDMRVLFKEVLNKEYSPEDYDAQFMLRVNENLAKIGRIERIYRETVSNTPQVVFDVLEAEKGRLLEAQARLGDYILPRRFA